MIIFTQHLDILVAVAYVGSTAAGSYVIWHSRSGCGISRGVPAAFTFGQTQNTPNLYGGAE